jgi:beta-glucosidase
MYKVSCKLAFFHHEETFRRSTLSGLEKRLNYTSYLESKGALPKLIGHFTREVKEPFFGVELRNMEPGQKPTQYFISQIENANKIEYRQNSLELPIKTSGKRASHGKLTIPFQLKAPIQMSLDSSLGGRQLAATTGPFELTQSQEWLKFPKEFKWGIATSSYQIEGGNTQSDWYRFEQEPGRVFQNDRSDDGPDHWNRVKEDIALLKKLGVQQYRMSIEWSRIEPQQGVWNHQAIEHYREEIRLLLENRIEPIITLWHSTLPLWVSDKGGGVWDGISGAFERFALQSNKAIAPEVKTWVTLNEPFLYLLGGYVKGAMPPGRIGGLPTLEKPLVNMLKAHARAYRILHKGNKDIRVGIAHRMDVFAPYTSYFWDGFLAQQADSLFNWAFPMAIKNGRLKVSMPGFVRIDVDLPEVKDTQDYYGLNYYTRFALEFQWKRLDLKERALEGVSDLTEMGWEMYPEGFYLTLKKIHGRFPTLPILILENGIADSTDRYRSQYIHHHLVYLHYAIEQGIPVENYCYWSLYDNFEWDQGFSIHVGLYDLNRETKERIPRPSADYFSQIIRDNGIRLQYEPRSGFIRSVR